MLSSRISGAGIRAKAENSLISRPIGIDLTDDGRDRFGEAVAILADLAGILALQALGGQPDRGQRVLDLVRDPPGHLGPGRLPLGRQQGGDVVEGDDVAQDGPRRAAARRAPAACAGAGRASSVRWRSTSSSGCGSAASRSLPRAAQDLVDRRADQALAASSRKSCAARLGSTMRRSASVPMTPALTPASTVSVKRRRSSSCRLASISSRRWLSSWVVIRLKARLSMTNSSLSGPSSGTGPGDRRCARGRPR